MTKSGYSVVSVLTPKSDVHDRYNGEGNVRRAGPEPSEEQQKQKREAKARLADAQKRLHEAEDAILAKVGQPRCLAK